MRYKHYITPDKELDQPQERFISHSLGLFLIVIFIIGSWLWINVIIKIILPLLKN